MSIKSCPRVESLEGRMLLSGSHGGPAKDSIAFLPAPGGAQYVVSQQASSITLTLERKPLGHNSLRDPLQVKVSTGSVTDALYLFSAAVPGVQFAPVSETITFPPGVASETVTIPVIAGAANP